MTITEQSRHHMLEALRAAIGEDEAMTLAEHLPPVGWADVATKVDVAAVRTDLRNVEERLGLRIDKLELGFEARFDAIDQRFVSIDQRFDAIDQRFDAIDQRFDAIDKRFDGLADQLRGDLHTALYKSGVGSTVTLGILLTALAIFA